MLRQTLFAATIVARAALAACTSSSGSSSTSSSSSSGSSGCTAYNPGAIDLTTPKVSFKTDVVVGVFNNSCGLSTSCHGSATASQGGLFLGAKSAAGADSSEVHTAVVGVLSKDLPTMPFVTAGDTSKSFLMHKMDGDQCLFASKCTSQLATGCGVVMPQASCALDGASRDKVRRWIAQGAQNN
jgi:hypothetical protein